MPKIPAISLARYYAQLRSVPGQNWAALALQQVESTTNQIIAAVNSPGATPAATTKKTAGGIAVAGGGGGGSGGITQLTGDVAAGPGTGAQAATLATVNGSPGSFTLANITVELAKLNASVASIALSVKQLADAALDKPVGIVVQEGKPTTH